MADSENMMFESIPEILEFLIGNQADLDHPFIELHDSLHSIYYKEYNKPSGVDKFVRTVIERRQRKRK